MVKFLLVLPDYGKGRAYNLPLGIAYASGALKAAGYPVRCLNLNHAAVPEETLRAEISAFDPDVVGTGTLSPYYQHAKWVLDTARDAKKDLATLLGGGVLTASPEKVFEGLNVDLGVIGEGEETVVEMAEALAGGRAMEEVDGLMFRDRDGVPQRNRERQGRRDLGGIAWPDFEGFDVDWLLDRQATTDSPFFTMLEDPRCLPMASSRSCPFACTFCFHPLGRGYRQRPLDDFFAELDHLVSRYRINMVEILDELFALKRDRLEEFCARIKPYGVRWFAQLHTTTVADDVIAMMADAGCANIGLGLESVHPAVLESMRKGTTPERIETAMATAFGKGMALTGNFIFGDPAETLETANHTLDWWSRHLDYGINLYRLQVLPGSPVYVRAADEGRIPDDPSLNWNRATNVTTMDDATYARLHERLEVLDTSLHPLTRILAFEPVAADPEERRAQYRVVWECGHCGAENDYGNVVLDQSDAFRGFRLACRSCGAWARLEHRARPVLRHRRAEACLADGLRSAAEGRTAEALASFREAAFIRVGDPMGDRPEASVLATYHLGRTLLDQGRVGEAIRLLGVVVKLRPFDAGYHLAFALALVREGSFSAARLHAQQARRLFVYHGNEGFETPLDGLECLLDQIEDSGGPPTFVV